MFNEDRSGIKLLLSERDSVRRKSVKTLAAVTAANTAILTCGSYLILTDGWEWTRRATHRQRQ